MARGNNVVIPSNSGVLTKTLYAERQTILVFNPNNGVVYVKINAPADATNWDWIVPSQSRVFLPGPWLEFGLFYVDQSGGGVQGNITVYETDQRYDVPDYAAIGVARLAQQTSLDVTEGTTPSNPGVGIARIWSDVLAHLHTLDSAGNDRILTDSATPLGGVLQGFMPNPSGLNPVDHIDFAEDAGPAVSTAGNTRIWADPTSHRIRRFQSPGSGVGVDLLDAQYPAGGLLAGSFPNPSFADIAFTHSIKSGPSGGISTSSTSPVNTDLTALGFSWVGGTTGLLVVSLTVQNNTAGGQDLVWVNIAGVGTSFIARTTCPSANTDYQMVGILPISLASGTYDFRVQFGVSAGTGSINAAVSGGNQMYLLNPRP